MQLEADWLNGPARQVCDLLDSAGYQAWYVGGCVRNALLEAAASDIDIATDAHPETVLDLAAAAGMRAIPTGVPHGTVTLVPNGLPVEVTTFRRDVETDGRRAVVAFSGDIAEDAARRDFTMNALYADRDGVVADPLGGLPDLTARSVRFIGDAEARIREDYLRILRFFRFNAWYGEAGALDADGLAACAEFADGLEGLSAERVGAEMTKLCAAPDPAPALAAMERSGVLWRVLPASGAAPVAVLVHLEPEAGLTPDPMLRLAALGGEGMADALRLSRKDATRVETLRSAAEGPDPIAVLGYRHGAEMAVEIAVLRAAFMTQLLPDNLEAEAARGASRPLPVTASELLADYQGPALGARLKQIESHWIASDFTATKQELMSLPPQ